mmetsp:Transcript_60535/g.138850  ORF Transcript_60535/g.138850 Transcript_60535/m.138850 type:complete len:444 (-) Transcript_60535:267-1598(-)
MEDPERKRMALEAADESRANAASLLLLPDDTEGNLHEAARAVRLEDDPPEHTPHLLSGSDEDEGLVVGCEEQLGGVEPADERQRRVDHVKHLHQQIHVLLARSVVDDDDRLLVAAARLLRAPRVLDDLRVDDVVDFLALLAEPSAFRDAEDRRRAALLVVRVRAMQTVAQEDLVSWHGIAAAALTAVWVRLSRIIAAARCGAVQRKQRRERHLWPGGKHNGSHCLFAAVNEIGELHLFLCELIANATGRKIRAKTCRAIECLVVDHTHPHRRGDELGGPSWPLHVASCGGDKASLAEHLAELFLGDAPRLSREWRHVLLLHVPRTAAHVCRGPARRVRRTAWQRSLEKLLPLGEREGGDLLFGHRRRGRFDGALDRALLHARRLRRRLARGGNLRQPATSRHGDDDSRRSLEPDTPLIAFCRSHPNTPYLIEERFNWRQHAHN